MIRLKLDITTRAAAGRREEHPAQARTQAAASQASTRRRVKITLNDPQVNLSAATEFDFALTVQEQEDFRWYFEDYGSNIHSLAYPYGQPPVGKPAAEVAVQIESKLAIVGRTLFKKVFNANEKSAALWAAVQHHLDEVRVEVITDETVIPWELFIDPETQIPLALSAASFVRTVPLTETEAPTPALPGQGGAVRILLVIPRIGGGANISLQSTAMRMLTGLCKTCRSYMHMDVLHPPTFANLENALRQAKEAEKPYHVIHFDGHSTIYEQGAEPTQRREEHTIHDEQGFLVFESADKPDLVSGARLARLMAETSVPLLSLNTCHSAYPGLQPAPAQGREEGLVQKRAFERVARACCAGGAGTGVAGVILMPYRIQVNTAAKFMVNMYVALAQGVSLGEAGRLGRKDLYTKPQREVSGDLLSLSDWCAPQIYESQILTIAPRAEIDGGPVFRVSLLERGKEIIPESIDRRLSSHLPKQGLVGRDEVILNLDRAFDYQGVVLLYGADGAGKTVAAAGLALWQTLSASATPVLVTLFENCRNFTDVLESFGQVYETALVERRISWYSLTDPMRQKLIQDIAKKVPWLWVMDNLESISVPGSSRWSEADKDALFQFLSSMKETQAKLLLISKRAEEDWLKDVPIRLRIPALGQTDGVQVLWSRFKDGAMHPGSATNWLPMLEIAQGNPAALILLAHQALAAGQLVGEGARDDQTLDRFAQTLTADLQKQAHETPGAGLDAVDSLIRLAVSRFTPQEQKVLALLALFQNFVDVDALCAMSNPKHSWHLQETAGLTREQGIALLDKVAELGLLTRIQLGYYLLPAALPHQLAWLFQQHYSDTRPLFAFVEMAKGLCSDYLFYYNQGNKDVLGVVMAEESNLLHALDDTLHMGWLGNLLPLLTVLRLLYTEGRRFAAWARLVNEVLPHFSNTKTQRPLRSRPLRQYHQEWVTLNDFRVENAKLRGNLSEAAEYQSLRVEWEKTRAAPSLRKDPANFTKKDRQTITTLDGALLELARIYRSMGSGRAREPFDEAYHGLVQLGEKTVAAGVALEIADVYIHIPVQRNLAAAEEWVQRSRGLRDAADLAGQGRCLVVLGQIAFERFLDAQKGAKPAAEQVALMNEALGCYFDALDNTPEDAAAELGIIHEALGFLYMQSEAMVDTALEHYDAAVQHKEKCEDRYGAAKARFNAAVALFLLSQFTVSKRYAQEALQGFEALGSSAAVDIQKARSLVARFTDE